MFHIISRRTNRQLNATITELHHRSTDAEARILQALAVLEGRTDEDAERVRAALLGKRP
ncbi:MULTISPECIES: hypothetical protein [unclassified Streptomyces]|uniref:hypothetical protein n=1 Tax=unclassified Streptomyces TaxID=2593676 RepID=UPI001314AC6E|nr:MULTISPECIES: hypothetical protein [unclassified Streptomyces]